MAALPVSHFSGGENGPVGVEFFDNRAKRTLDRIGLVQVCEFIIARFGKSNNDIIWCYVHLRTAARAQPWARFLSAPERYMSASFGKFPVPVLFHQILQVGACR